MLRAHKPELAERFGVADLALFGSTVRDEALPASTWISWSASTAANSKRYFGVQFYLEDLLGRPVDLVTDKALRPEFRPSVEAEAVHI